MLERETILPLAIGLLLSVAAHLALLPVAAAGLHQMAKAKANLRLLEVRAAETATAGQRLLVGFTVTNVGNAPAERPWQDKIYISNDQLISPDDVALKTLERPHQLKAHQQYQRHAIVELPKQIHEGKFLIVHTDAEDVINEGVYGHDNIGAVSIWIIAPDRPDLTVLSITSPDHVEAGESITVGFQVTNVGPLSTQTGHWKDRLFLSRDEQLDKFDKLLATSTSPGPLEPDQQHDGSPYHVKLSEEVAGTVYLIVQTDTDDEVDEYPNENNNTLAVPLIIDRQKTAQTDKKPIRKRRPKVLEKPKPPELAKPKPKKVLQLGRDDALPVRTVAWIPFDEYEKLIAPNLKLLQPALQTKTDPVRKAPARLDATAPSPALATAGRPGQVPLPVPATEPNRKTPLQTNVLEPVKQIEANAPEQKPVPPLNLPPAEPVIERPRPTVPTVPTVATAPTLPTPEPAEPAIASATVADEPSPEAEPNRQEERGLPKPTKASVADQSPRLLSDPAKIDPRFQEASEAPLITDTPPADQNPSDGGPTPQQKGSTTEDTQTQPTTIEGDEGESSKTPRPTTPDPAEDPKPAKAKPLEGHEGDPKPKKAATPSKARKPLPAGRSGKPTRPAPSTSKDKPTTAARSDRESTPVSPKKPIKALRPGKVPVGEGLELQTVAPRISVISSLTAAPKNALVLITFDKEGIVTNVKFRKHTGYTDIDAALEAAIYKWKAKGKQLSESVGPLNLEITLRWN